MMSVAVVVSALGYFVDIYDLLLFSIVRVESLRSLGVAPGEMLAKGVFLINVQMVGLLLGGLLWGILGDKKGRLSVLFGSILLYSVANLGNSFATSVTQYAAFRFAAGVGLAGELGAAITLVSETLSPRNRGYGTSVVAGVGILGAVFAGWVGETFTWRVAFGMGGGMGLVLLCLRVSMAESGIYTELDDKDRPRKGDVRMLFHPWSRFVRYLRCILIGVPIWCVVGVLLTFSPELSHALGIEGEVSAGRAVLFGYAGLSAGDFLSGILSQRFRSRKKVVGGYLVLTLALMLALLNLHGASSTVYYALCAGLGAVSGYWAIFVTLAAESFGTNLRATVTTTVPNFVRASVIPLTLAFRALTPAWGLLGAATAVCVFSVAVGLLALWRMEDTYGKSLSFVEH